MDARDAANRDLLIGLLALQSGLVEQDELILAFRAWTRDKSRPIAEVLVTHGAIDADERALLEGLAAKHLSRHDGDTAKSVAALSPGTWIRVSLAEIGDPQIDATLGHDSGGSRTTEYDDAERTTSYGGGATAANGQRFQVLRPHARGGLGVVFVALDSELNREVALKQILDHHADDPISRQRFLLEAEITGGLEHPGIVPVYGLGLYAGGRPYYAMRLIRGDSLKDAIERFHNDEALQKDHGRRSLELRKLLGRFIDVCDAIEYAHSRGVLHRDIKPANIIVGKHGETLVVDWGLAKVQRGSEAFGSIDERPLVPTSASGSAETLPGSAIGTPAYMSPEQARGDLAQLGPRSDVFSLGATLYCLLTGRPPVESDDIGAMMRAVQKGEFPPPRKINPTIDKALEMVCQKAMATLPEDRYARPTILSNDIESWLAGEPVSAYAEPLGARARRWARRHRTPVITTACLLVASVIGLTAGLILIRAKQQETEVARAEAIRNYQVAEQARKAADAARRDAEANFANAMNAVETMLIRVSQKHLANLPHFEPVRRQLLEDALGFYRDFLVRAGNSPSVAIQAARAFRVAGDIHLKLGQRDRAREELRKSLEILEPAPASVERALVLADVHYSLGEVDAYERHVARSIEEYQSGLAVLAPFRTSPVEPRIRRALLDSEVSLQSNLGGRLNLAARLKEAGDAFRRARLALEQLMIDAPQDETYRHRLSANEHNEGLLLYEQNELPDAVEHWRKAVRLQDELLMSSPNMVHILRDQANTYKFLGFGLARLGRYSDAVKTGRRSVALFGQLAADYPTVFEYPWQLAAAHHSLGFIYDVGNDLAHAETEFRRSISSLESLRRREPENPNYIRDLANSHMYLGNALTRVRRFQDAVIEISRARDLFDEVVRLRPDDAECRFQLAGAEHNRADALNYLGRLGEAAKGFRRSQSLLDELLARNPDNPHHQSDLANSTLSLGRCLLEQGERAQAQTELARALGLLDQLIAKSPQNEVYLEGRGRALILLGRLDDGLEAARALAALPDQSGRNLYRAACVLAFNLPLPGQDPVSVGRVPTDHAGNLADRAIGLLAQALTRGHQSREGFVGDSELDGLRAHPEFRALLDIFLDRVFPADPFVQ